MGKLTKQYFEQHSDEWKAFRNQYIGGSDAAAIVGMNDFSSPYSVWAEKTGKVPGFEGNMSTKVGTFLEDFVAKLFEEETGKRVQRDNATITNSDYPWACANIDRQVIGEDAGLEIKTTGEFNLKKFKNGEFPENYYAQCVHYLAVTGKQRWYLAVLIGNKDFKVFTIERDEAEIKALMDAEEEFWTYVETNSPPPADGHFKTTETIKKVYGSSVPVTVELFGMDDMLKRREVLKAQVKELSAEIDSIENQVKVAMGEAEAASCGKYKVTWKPVTRHNFDKDRYEATFGKISDDFYEATTSRTLRIAERKEKKNG